MGQKFCTPGSGATSAAQAKQTPEYNSLPATHTGAVLGCSWLGDSIVTCGDDNRVAVTELGKSGEVKVFEGHERSVNCVEGCSSTGTVFSASRDTTVRAWTNEGAGCEFHGHTLTVMAVSATLGGELVVSGGRDYAVKVWDSSTGQCTSTSKISRNLVTCLQFFKDGGCKFAQGSEDLTMRIWDVRIISNTSSHASTSLTFGKYVYFPLDCDTSSCSNYVCTSSKGFDGSGCEGRIWDVRKPDVPLHVLSGHQQDAVGCAFLEGLGENGGRLMVTVSKDETIKVWNVDNGNMILSHCEEESGMWTSVRAYGGGGEDGPHFVATSFLGGVYVYRIEWKGKGARLKLTDMIRPGEGEETYDEGRVPKPSEL
ncbi:hypothetical protein TrST_g7244 [Triparma strigata]|uniref:Guanine nucleotide-binding protein subunit beta-like protein n=1 Tax=Triparma strigata TaxID=1606541 RepID=A0A9W7ETV0_9STRA|nr:hypothetical protein TrST_g7244 [Triparma strigata]